MAITAWSAKVLISAICRSVKGSIAVAAEDDGADRLTLAQQRDAERRPQVAHPDDLRHAVVRIGRQVLNMDGLTGKHGAPDHRFSALMIALTQRAFDLCREAKCSNDADGVLAAHCNRSRARATEPRCCREDGVQHRLNV